MIPATPGKRLQLASKRGLARLRLRKLADFPRSRSGPDALFLWIPKTAGTSVADAFASRGCRKFKSAERIRFTCWPRGFATFVHLSLAEVTDQGLVPRNWVARSRRFTFVRHPIHRAVSLFRYLGKLGVLSSSAGFDDFLALLPERFDPSPLPELEHFPRRWLAWEGDLARDSGSACPSPGLFNSFALSQCRPQVEWLRLPRGIPPSPEGYGAAHFVGRVETLASDLPHLCEELGLPVPSIPHRNPSRGRPPDLTPAQITRITELYRADFDAFGYLPDAMPTDS